jgi:hypothetical protein
MGERRGSKGGSGREDQRSRKDNAETQSTLQIAQKIQTIDGGEVRGGMGLVGSQKKRQQGCRTSKKSGVGGHAALEG